MPTPRHNMFTAVLVLCVCISLGLIIAVFMEHAALPIALIACFITSIIVLFWAFSYPSPSRQRHHSLHARKKFIHDLFDKQERSYRRHIGIGLLIVFWIIIFSYALLVERPEPAPASIVWSGSGAVEGVTLDSLVRGSTILSIDPVALELPEEGSVRLTLTGVPQFAQLLDKDAVWWKEDWQFQTQTNSWQGNLQLLDTCAEIVSAKLTTPLQYTEESFTLLLSWLPYSSDTKVDLLHTREWYVTQYPTSLEFGFYGGASVELPLPDDFSTHPRDILLIHDHRSSYIQIALDGMQVERTYAQIETIRPMRSLSLGSTSDVDVPVGCYVNMRYIDSPLMATSESIDVPVSSLSEPIAIVGNGRIESLTIDVI